MKVNLTAQAEADLRTIGEWISRDDPLRAVTFVAELRQKALLLAEEHGHYPVIWRAGSFGQVRRRNYKGYRILFDVRADVGTIDILFIHHGRRANRSFT